MWGLFAHGIWSTYSGFASLEFLIWEFTGVVFRFGFDMHSGVELKLAYVYHFCITLAKLVLARLRALLRLRLLLKFGSIRY